ncbi:ABC transporter permease [Actinopolymorpha alba]|uniref:ABC transporter permease n=1 Tax=Actinopolymorpha alba TaxID=533267 RepID=UPI00036B2D20|nr:ABC-2 family transporter protein [Actinopolymorpha alba]
MRTFKLYAALVGAGLRGEAQYRGNLLVMLVAGMAYQGIGLAFVWVVVDRFGAIGGWTLGEVFFLYALRLTAHGLWVVPFSQLNQLDLVVREGEFDRYLVRPLNPLVQVLTRRVGLMQAGDLVGGLLLLAYATTIVDVDWSPGAVGFLLLAVVGGALVEVAVQLGLSGLTFRLLSTRMLRIQVDSVFGTFGNYPLKIFPSVARFLFTIVLPMAFVAYFPASVLLDRTGELAVPSWFAYGSPLVGAALFTLAYLFWSRQTSHYTSSGH